MPLAPAAIELVARLFVEARRTGHRMQPLPDALRPASTAEVNAINDRVAADLGEPIAGWKIGFVYSPRQEPFICPIYASTLFTSPAKVPLSFTPGLNIEPEISFRLLDDLPAREKPYRAPEVAEVLEACASLEIVDTRFDIAQRSIRQMLDDRRLRYEAWADCNVSGAYIVATGRRDWTEFDFARMPMTMRTPDRVLVQTVGGHAFDDPFLPCVVLANRMRHRGGMRRGQILVTGSFAGFWPAHADEPVTAHFEGFGSCEATFVS